MSRFTKKDPLHKEMLLLRHAKAATTYPIYDDFDRPLDIDGYKSLNELMLMLAEQTINPRIVLCSPARRTRETLDALRGFLPETSEVYFEESLYLADLSRMRTCLETIPADVSSIMVIAHNPGLEHLLSWLLQTNDATERPVGDFPMAGLAHLSVKSPTWSLAEGVACSLLRFVLPSPISEIRNLENLENVAVV